MAVLDSTYRPGIDPQFLTVNLGTDVDMDKLDITILDKDGKPLNVGEPEIKQVGEENGVPQYVLVYKGKIQKSQIKNQMAIQGYSPEKISKLVNHPRLGSLVI